MPAGALRALQAPSPLNTVAEKERTKDLGAGSVLECVGTQESMRQAIDATRPGGFVSDVGVPHGVQLDGAKLFFTHVHLQEPSAPLGPLETAREVHRAILDEVLPWACGTWDPVRDTPRLRATLRADGWRVPGQPA